MEGVVRSPLFRQRTFSYWEAVYQPKLRAYRGTDIPAPFGFQQCSDHGLDNAGRPLSSVRLNTSTLNVYSPPQNRDLVRILDASS